MNKTMKPTEEDDGDVYINGWSKLEFEKRSVGEKLFVNPLQVKLLCTSSR